MILQHRNFKIEIIDETRWHHSTQNDSHNYAKEVLPGKDFQISPCYGIVVMTHDQPVASCKVTVNGGPTAVNANSAVCEDGFLYVAIGDSIYCFEIPSLDLKWNGKVDASACFGVHHSPDNQGILSHGEQEIAKIDFEGRILWSASGKDIFSEGFTVFADHIEAIDFYREIYSIRLSDGQVSIL